MELFELAGSGEGGFARDGVVPVDEDGAAASVVENYLRLASQVSNAAALLGVESKVSAPVREPRLTLTLRAFVENDLETIDRHLSIAEHELSAGNIHILLSLPDNR